MCHDEVPQSERRLDMPKAHDVEVQGGDVRILHKHERKKQIRKHEPVGPYYFTDIDIELICFKFIFLHQLLLR